jgi:hypothetical protein
MQKDLLPFFFHNRHQERLYNGVKQLLQGLFEKAVKKN